MINKATPTATLAVNNSPVTYDGTAKAATVAISASSVPGAVANILTGGTATKTNAGTYAVTADFVPTDTANYNSLLAQAAGNFVINKATPTATLAVNNSPQTYDATAKAATVAISASSVPGAVANILTGGTATKTERGHLCGDGGLRADRHGQLQQPAGPGGGELRDQQGDADGDAGGQQLAADL